MDASIVIASRNEGANLLRTVDSIVENSSRALEVIVVDDGSTDNSLDALIARRPAVRVFRHEESRGVSPSRVSGAQLASTSILMFFDAHVKPATGCIDLLIDDVLRSPAAFFVPRVTQLNVDSWQEDLNMQGFGYQLSLDECEGSWIDKAQMRTRSIEGRVYYESPAIVGCALAVSREAYLQTGGFDEGMKVWGSEDVDLGIRAWMLGLPVLCNPAASLAHRFVTEFSQFSSKMREFGSNQLRMARKLLSDETFAHYLAIRELRDLDVPPTEEHASFWREAYDIYQEDEAQIESFATSFRGRRLRDEYAYADYFGLLWPRQNV